MSTWSAGPGATLPAYGIAGTNAEFFVIMPSTAGWELCHGMEGRGWFARWDHALQAAGIMAEARHQAADIATTVVVDMKKRDAAIVSVYA